jgi:SPP1 family predicted phage head-tail adaptor
MITAGKLSERIKILSPTVQRAESGEQLIEYQEVKTIWANVVFQRGSQALSAGEVYMNRSIVVTIRNNSLITDRCRIQWDGKIYAIESLNRSVHDGSITITATVVDEGNLG